MDTATISASSALAGTAIGGLTSGLTTLINQSAQARADQIRHDLGRREDLVRDFIIAASKTYGEAFATSEPQLPELVDLYSMVSRMRVLAMPRSVASAEKLMLVIIECRGGPVPTDGHNDPFLRRRGSGQRHGWGVRPARRS